MSLPGQSETQFKDQVIDLAKLFKWKVHHDRPARTKKGWRTATQGDAGFPDLVLARAGVVIFAELKTQVGRQTLEQKLWEQELPRGAANGADLQAYGGYALWRPADMREIKRILR